MNKLKIHLFTLPRWFAAPFFGSSVLIGAVLAGGINMYVWITLILGMLLMAAGHSWNSFLDYAWTGLDKGEQADRSAEKAYTGGQNLIETKQVSLREVLTNACIYDIASLLVLQWVTFQTGHFWSLIILWIAGFIVPFWYSWGKFNYTQELALGISVGPIPVLLGMYTVSPNPPIINGLLVSVPMAIILSFMGLALDEWPDAEANLKKGVKSFAYKVWEYSDNQPPLVFSLGAGPVTNKSLTTLLWYCTAWLMFMCIYHVFLISIGVLAPLTALALVVVPLIFPALLLLKKEFRKTMTVVIALGALYPLLMLLGQWLGR